MYGVLVLFMSESDTCLSLSVRGIKGDKKHSAVAEPRLNAGCFSNPFVTVTKIPNRHPKGREVYFASRFQAAWSEHHGGKSMW